MYSLIALVVMQGPPVWDWQKVYPEFKEAEEQYLLWVSHLQRLKELRPAWEEAGVCLWDGWEYETEEIMQLWRLVMEARKPQAAGRRWFKATETALANLEAIMGTEAFRAGRIPRMPKGCYKPFAPVPAAPPVILGGMVTTSGLSRS